MKFLLEFERRNVILLHSNVRNIRSKLFCGIKWLSVAESTIQMTVARKRVNKLNIRTSLHVHLEKRNNL